MLTTASFFASLPEGHETLFPDGQPVWQSLKNLKEYLAGYRFEPLPASLISGTPLAATVAWHEGRLFDRDLVIEYGDATKGKLRVRHLGKELPRAAVIMAGAVIIGPDIAIGPGVLIEPGAFIKGPVIIGANTEIRQGAYVRGTCLFGARCVVGHVTETKNAIFLDDAKAGHFAYLGDSILGNRVNLGAGTKLANLRFLGGEVSVRTPDGPVATGLRKLGAILGDDVQTGCNSVTNPGTLMAPKTMLMPNTTSPSGFHPRGTILR